MIIGSLEISWLVAETIISLVIGSGKSYDALGLGLNVESLVIGEDLSGRIS